MLHNKIFVSQSIEYFFIKISLDIKLFSQQMLFAVYVELLILAI